MRLVRISRYPSHQLTPEHGLRGFPIGRRWNKARPRDGEPIPVTLIVRTWKQRFRCRGFDQCTGFPLLFGGNPVLNACVILLLLCFHCSRIAYNLCNVALRYTRFLCRVLRQRGRGRAGRDAGVKRQAARYATTTSPARLKSLVPHKTQMLSPRNHLFPSKLSRK